MGGYSRVLWNGWKYQSKKDSTRQTKQPVIMRFLLRLKVVIASRTMCNNKASIIDHYVSCVGSLYLYYHQVPMRNWYGINLWYIQMQRCEEILSVHLAWDFTIAWFMRIDNILTQNILWEILQISEGPPNLQRPPNTTKKGNVIHSRHVTQVSRVNVVMEFYQIYCIQWIDSKRWQQWLI